MGEIAINQLLVLILQCVIVGSLLLFLFRLRHIFGLSLLFAALGVFQYLQTFLVAAIYIEIIPGIEVSPGSMVLFTGSLFAILLIYIREDAIQARKVIYALLSANLVLAVLQLIFSWSVMGQHAINIYNLPKEFFMINSRVLLAGTIVLVFDAFVIIFIYEMVSRYLSSLFFRICLSMAIVVSLDTLLFSLGAFAGTELFSVTLFSGLIAKLLATIIYSLIFWIYLVQIDRRFLKLDIGFSLSDDIFQTLTYRQKYEQVSFEKFNKSIELQKSKIRFQTLFESMIQGVIYQNADGQIFAANPAAERILGLTIEQMQGKTSMDPNWKAIHEDGSDFLGETHAGMVALKTGKPVHNVIIGVFNNNNNDYRWLKVNATPLFKNSEKNAYQVFTTFEDITNERNSQRKLKELYIKYQNIIHTANIGIVELDKEGNYTFVNPSWEVMFGYNSNEALGKHKELISPKDQVKNLLFDTLIQGEISNYQIERKYRAKNGQPVWCDVYVAANNDLQGNLKSIVVVMTNITERKIRQNELKASEERFRTIVEGAPDPIFIQSNEYFVYLNKLAVELFGAKDESELIGKPVLNYFHSDYHKMTLERIKRLNVNKTIVHDPFEQILVQLNGNEIWVETKGEPVFYNGEHCGLVFIRDITTRKNAESKMDAYKKSLQKLTTELMLAEEKQRKEIAANIHDHLSQSLVISKMKLHHLWKQMETDNHQSEIAIVINHISEALENTRKITYELSPPVLYELGLIDAVYWLAEKIEVQNQIKVTFETDFDDIKLSEPKLILIYRAIQEILNNAIKHSGANQIYIHFTKDEFGLQILINDKGKGFDKSVLDSKSHLNTGFGLFAVRERIENLQGTLIINSTLGLGTELKIFVPLKSNKLMPL